MTNIKEVEDAERRIKPKETKSINIDDIESSFRYRDEMGDLDSLRKSIEEKGLIHNITVKEVEGEKFRLLAGERRLRVIKELGWKTVTANIYDSNISELDERAIELYENIIRKDFTYVEEVSLKNRLHKLMVDIHGEKSGGKDNWEGWSLRDTAKLLDESSANVSRDLKLAKAMEVIPVLKEAKTKRDAMKMLSQMEEKVVLEEIKKRVEKGSQGDVKKRALTDSYIIGDIFKRIKEVQDKSIDLIEIDPPYGIDLKNVKKLKVKGDINLDDYTEIPLKEYEEWLTKLLKECYRVGANNSWTLLWFGITNIELVKGVIEKTEYKYFPIPSIWRKRRGQSHNPDLIMGNVYETFFYLRKGNITLNKPGRLNVFDYNEVNPDSKIHKTERPIELMMDILYTFSPEGSRVLVPFLGSGNTLLAASNLGMTAFGFELEESFRNSFILRVEKGKLGEFSSYRAE